jgi:hypothetical protein
MGTAPKQFDQDGNLVDDGTVKFLDHFFDEVDNWYSEISK